MHHWGDFMKDVIFDGKYAAAAGLRREQRDVTKLNWTELTRFCFFKKLTNGQAGQAHWSLVDAYVSVVT